MPRLFDSMNWVPEKLAGDVHNQIMTMHPSVAKSRNGISCCVLGQRGKQSIYRISQDISGDVHVGTLSSASCRFYADFP